MPSDGFCFESTSVLLRRHRFESVGDAICACLVNELVEWLRIEIGMDAERRIAVFTRIKPVIEEVVARNDDGAIVLANQGERIGVYILRTDENFRENIAEVTSECICLSSSRVRQEVEKGGFNARH